MVSVKNFTFKVITEERRFVLIFIFFDFVGFSSIIRVTNKNSQFMRINLVSTEVIRIKNYASY